VGERGQVVIPAEARKKLNINPGEKLLVISHPFAAGLMLVKMDMMREYLSAFLEGLSAVSVGTEHHEAKK
jgi:bifunctional DNA-binding transcriptional regulator/antitoxin component of YhaV-PrlF toxin-antitoxin module